MKLNSKIGLVISTFVSVLMVLMGYYYLTLGTEGRIDFGVHEYFNRMLWFFGSITLISAQAFLHKYRSIMYNFFAFFITFMSMYIGYTMTGAVTFDATSDAALGVNVLLIARSSVLFAIVAIIILIVISFWFSSTTGDFLQSIFKAGLSMVFVIGAAFAINYIGY